jgi:serine phosphatase RsbU (regulator of sigma subunit)
VSELNCDPCFPFGLGIAITQSGHCRLQPGDRVLFYSDGAIEARPSSGEQFGLERLVSEVEQYIGAGVLAAETLRRLAARLRQHRGGELEDDATLVFLEWLPGR